MLTRGLGHGESKTENSPATSIDEAGELTKQELSRISAAIAKLNEEGREREVEYAEDLAAGGRYKNMVRMNWVKKRRKSSSSL